MMDLHEVIILVGLVALSDVGLCGEFSGGRTYILNPKRLSWDNALMFCESMNGSLATIRSMATVPMLDIKGNWTFWIDIRHNELMSDWRRGNGSTVTFFNWKWDVMRSRGSGRDCAVSSTLVPYWWTPHNCTEELPSLCEFKQGDCRYVVVKNSGLVGHNRNIILRVSVAVCEEACSEEVEYECRSFMYDSSQRVCTLTESDRYTSMSDFRLNTDTERDYYQRTCDAGYIMENATESPLMVIAPTPVLETSSVVLPSPSLTCLELRTFAVNETIPVMEEVKELQSIGVTLKKRAARLKKISIPDKRPSSTYIGTSAIAISIAFAAVVILLDLVSITRYCRHNPCCSRLCNSKSFKKVSQQTKEERVMQHHFQAMKKHMRVLALQGKRNPQVEEEFDAAIFDRDDEVLSEHSFTNDLYDDWTGGHPVSPTAHVTKHYDWFNMADDNTPVPQPEPKADLKWPDDIILDDVPVHRCKYVDNKTKYIYRSHISTHL